VPFGFDEFLVPTYTGSFWQLLNPFALVAGVVASAMITMHGGTYLAHRTEGAIQQRAVRAAVWAAVVMVLAFIGAGVWLRVGGIEGFVITSVIDPAALPDPLAKTVERSAGGWWLNYAHRPLLWLLPLTGVSAALLAAALALWGRTLAAFVASALAIAGVIGTAGAAMFPFVMPSSSHPSASLTVWDSVSSHLTLGLMFWATVIFMPLIVFYTGWAYRVMRGKVTVAHIRANEHTAY
jgi:cytochrome d ubiquinol oxidase subunit II